MRSKNKPFLQVKLNFTVGQERIDSLIYLGCVPLKQGSNWSVTDFKVLVLVNREFSHDFSNKNVSKFHSHLFHTFLHPISPYI